MRQKLKRLTAVIMAFALGLSLFSTNAWAAEVIVQEDNYNIASSEETKQTDELAFEKDFDAEKAENTDVSAEIDQTKAEEAKTTETPEHGKKDEEEAAEESILEDTYFPVEETIESGGDKDSETNSEAIAKRPSTDSSSGISTFASGDYKSWSQSDSRWGSLKLGSSSYTVSSSGCLVTSVTKLIIQAGLKSEDSFNVATLVNWMNSNGGFTSDGDMYWAKPAEYVSGLSYYGNLLKYSSYSSSNYDSQLLSWIKNGYHIVLNVNSGGHWIAIDEEKSIATGTIYIMNSLSSGNNVNVTLASQYSTFNRAVAYTGGNTPTVVPTGSQILSDGDYHIVTALDDSFGLNVEYNSTESGKNIQIHNSMGDDETYSVVTVTYVGNGYYKLTMRNSGKVLDVASAGTAPGTNVQQYNDNGSDAQQWVIQHAGGNNFNIISKCNGLYLDVSGGTANDYTNVQVYTGNGGNGQKWKFIAWGQPTGQTIADGRYKIASALDNTKLVDVSGAGTDNSTNVQLWTDTPGAAQIWDVKYVGNGFYMLTDVNSGRNLDVSGGNAADNTNVKIYDNNGSNAQRWIIKSAGDGYYFVISKIAGQHLDALKAASDDGTNIQVYHNYSSTNNAQKWAFIRQRENKITFDMQGGSVDGSFTTMTADHVNGGRGAGELVIYNIGNTTVNTNIYGCELAVNDTGYVSKIRRHGDETQLSVPNGGLVISGHHGWSDDIPSPYGGYLFTNQVNVGDYVGFNYETNLTAAYHDRDSYLIENKYVDTGAVYGDLPVPEKEGYYFDGWYTAAKGGTRILRTSTYSADTLYAHWTAVDDQAPVTSMEYNGHTYEVYDYHMSWKEARAFCEERGGHLVTISNAEENSAVTDLIKQGSSGIYYIGCTDEEREGTWKWITGEAFDYNNWDPHAPEPNGGADDGIDYGHIIAVQNLPNKHVGEWADDVDKNTDPGFYSYANTGFVCEYEETEKVIASGTCGTNVKWNLTDAGSLNITGSGAMKAYTYTKEVPWYSYVSQITSVNIADGVTYISDYAFYGLTRLKTITIPDSVRSIGDYAFKNAVGLESVTLSGNLNRLGESAFFGCTALKSIELPEGLYTIWEYTFKNCTSLTNVSLPQSLIKIDEAAFYGCSALTGLDIPGNVTIIGQYAFKNCSKLKELTLSSKMTEIREAAFYGTAIETLDVPEGITKIGPYAFKKCEKLVTLNLPDSLTQIDESAFYGSSMETLVLPENVTKIGSYSFKGCGKLREIRFPKELLTIGDSAFYYCTSLSDITLPEKLTTIEGYAFKNCTALTGVNLPASLKTIGDSAFYSCTGLTEITIPAGVTGIGAYCFSKDSALKTIRFEGNAPAIGTAAFRSVTGNAYYPKGNTTWTDAVKQNYGGSISWIGQ